MTFKTKGKVKTKYYAVFYVSADIGDGPPLIDPILVAHLNLFNRACNRKQVLLQAFAWNVYWRMCSRHFQDHSNQNASI